MSATNPTLDLIGRHRSVRAFSPEPLSLAEKEAILNAAYRAPTAGNLMLYAILEIDDQAIKDRLAVTCDHQPFIARAPWVLVFLADYQRWYDAFLAAGVEQRCRELERPFRKPQEGDLFIACCDALIAAQNAALAAESLGIGTCYIGDVFENCEIHRQLLDLPPYTFPIAMLCFGRPAGEAPRSLTRRFPPDFILHKNHYCRLDPGQIQRMLQPLDEQFTPAPDGPQNAAQGVYFRKFSADYTFEMTRSARQFLKSWSE